MNMALQKITVKSKVMVLAILAIIAAAALFSYLTLLRFESVLAPELGRNAIAVGESVEATLVKVVGYGVPFAKLRGMDSYLDGVLKDNPDIAYLAVTDRGGRLRYSSGHLATGYAHYLQRGHAAHRFLRRTRVFAGYLDSTLPLKGRHGIFGYVHIGQSQGIIHERLKNILYDIITVVVVAVLMAFEILLFLMTYTIQTPMQQVTRLIDGAANGDFRHAMTVDARDEIGRVGLLINHAIEGINATWNDLRQRYLRLRVQWPNENELAARVPSYIALKTGNQFIEGGKLERIFTELTVYIRPALFLLVFAESLSLSFFPIYVESLYTPIAGLPKDLVIGLPISIFMLVWALSLPSAGSWSDRIGRRKPFLVGALITAVGLVLTGMAHSVYDLLVWRSITAVGYGIVFITCQGYVTDQSGPKNRTRGMAMFLAGFFSGSLCGAAIGGILAERIGYSMTFVLSAALALVAALFVSRFIQDAPRDPNAPVRRLSLGDFKAMLSNWRFMTLTVFAAIPAKIALTGFLYYTGPLYLSYLGNAQSTMGRIIMAYGIAIIALSPIIGRLADAYGRRKLFVVTGGALSTTALLLLYFHPSTVGVLASITLLGVAHAIGVSPQIALMTELCQRDSARVGLGTAIGIFRFIERFGNIAGPLIAGGLITVYGFSGAFLGIGLLTLGGVIVFSTVFAIDSLRGGAGPLRPEEASS